MENNQRETMLKEKYILYRWQYAIGKECASDAEYNELHSYISNTYPNWEYVKRSWSSDPCPVDLLKKIGREDLISNVVRTFTSESMPSLRTDEEVEDAFISLNERTRVSIKLDGWNHQVNYFNGHFVNANTRGRGVESKESDVVRSVVPSTILENGSVKVFGELTIASDKWEEFKRVTGNTDQRASVSTAIAKNMSEYLVFTAFNIDCDRQINDKYAILKDWGFEVPTYLFCSDYATLKNAIKMLSSMKEKINRVSDGLVVENSKVQVALRVGAWQEKDLYSYVTGYTENTTPYGRSLVVNIKPIQSQGKTISQLDVTNINRILSNNLRIGYPVVFAVRSGSNPVFNESATLKTQDEWEDSLEEYRRSVDLK